MSECLKSYLIAKKNHKKHLRQFKSKNKPAEKNINYNYADSISYNLIESMTMFKNNEINKNALNLSLLSNLSLFISKGDLDEKKIKKNKNKVNLDNRKCSINNYGIYFPTKRITCLEEIKIKNNKSSNNNPNKKVNNFFNNIKIPFINEKIDTFLPLGRNILDSSKLYIKNDGKKKNDHSYDMTLNQKLSKSSSSLHNESENSLSLLSEESLIISIKESNNINNKDLLDINNKQNFKNLKKFKKYKQLTDYIECPLINKETIQEKYNNFIKLLDNVDVLFEKMEFNDINNSNEHFDLNDENEIKNKKVYIDNCQIINNSSNINIEQTKNKNNLISPILDKKYKSVNVSKISKYNNNNDLLFLNSTFKNDLSETLDKTSSSLKQNNTLIINNKTDKTHEISPSLRKKYLKRMNENYILLIHKIYMNFISKCLLAKSNFLNDIMIKKLFLQLFKQFLLNLGIDNKKIYEKILKTQIFSNKLLTFDQFIQTFDIIIYDNESVNLKEKFSFILNIISCDNENDNDFLNSKKIELFFDLLGCSAIYIRDFCENLGEKLVIRFNVVYKKDEENNILLGKYRLRKMKIVLDSFFDDLQIDI